MHPVMFRLAHGPPFYSYGVMLTIAIGAGFLLSWRLVRIGRDAPGFTDLVLCYVAAYLAGAGGATLYWMLENAADRPLGRLTVPLELPSVDDTGRCVSVTQTAMPGEVVGILSSSSRWLSATVIGVP